MEFPLLDQTGISGFLSDWGRNIYMPQGIFYWSGRAKKEADINATIGTARGRMRDFVKGGDDAVVTCHLPMFARHFPTLPPDDVFSYAPVLGKPSFRKAWRDWIVYKGGDLGKKIKDLVTLPMTTSGVTGGLFVMTRLLVDPGEAVVSPDKRWGNYDSIVTLNCGHPFESFPLFEGGKFNTVGLREALLRTWEKQPKTTLILNIPNNPTGYTPDADEAGRIRDTLLGAVRESGKRLAILFDDAYEGYVYDDKGVTRSVFFDYVDADPNLLPVKLDGVTKELLFYGGRIGLITFGLHRSWVRGLDLDALQSELDTKVAGVVRTTISNCCHPTQSAAEQILQQREQLLEERSGTVRLLAERVRVLHEESRKYDPAEVEVDPCNGGFFAFFNIKGVSATAVAEKLITKYKVAVVPTEKKGQGINGIRVAFCGVPLEDMRRLCQAIPQAVTDVRQENA